LEVCSLSEHNEIVYLTDRPTDLWEGVRNVFYEVRAEILNIT